MEQALISSVPVDAGAAIPAVQQSSSVYANAYPSASLTSIPGNLEIPHESTMSYHTLSAHPKWTWFAQWKTELEKNGTEDWLERSRAVNGFLRRLIHDGAPNSERTSRRATPLPTSSLVSPTNSIVTHSPLRQLPPSLHESPVDVAGMPRGGRGKRASLKTSGPAVSTKPKHQRRWSFGSDGTEDRVVPCGLLSGYNATNNTNIGGRVSNASPVPTAQQRFAGKKPANNVVQLPTSASSVTLSSTGDTVSHTSSTPPPTSTLGSTHHTPTRHLPGHDVHPPAAAKTRPGADHHQHHDEAGIIRRGHELGYLPPRQSTSSLDLAAENIDLTVGSERVRFSSRGGSATASNTSTGAAGNTRKLPSPPHAGGGSSPSRRRHSDPTAAGGGYHPIVAEYDGRSVGDASTTKRSQPIPVNPASPTAIAAAYAAGTLPTVAEASGMTGTRRNTNQSSGHATPNRHGAATSITSSPEPSPRHRGRSGSSGTTDRIDDQGSVVAYHHRGQHTSNSSEYSSLRGSLQQSMQNSPTHGLAYPIAHHCPHGGAISENGIAPAFGVHGNIRQQSGRQGGGQHHIDAAHAASATAVGTSQWDQGPTKVGPTQQGKQMNGGHERTASLELQRIQDEHSAAEKKERLRAYFTSITPMINASPVDASTDGSAVGNEAIKIPATSGIAASQRYLGVPTAGSGTSASTCSGPQSRMSASSRHSSARNSSQASPVVPQNATVGHSHGQ